MVHIPNATSYLRTACCNADDLYRRVCDLFEDHPLWKAVHASDRRDVFDDVTFTLAKRERVRLCCCLHVVCYG